MASKRKTVRFAERGADEEEPSDAALIQISKKRRLGDDRCEGPGEAYDDAIGDAGVDLARSAEYDSKHTLESDEEEEEKYDRLDVEDVDGQEEATIDFDDDVKITPFNMKEELDDGHFDTEGNFIFNKKGERLKDEWLDNIDWAKIKKDAGKFWESKDGEETKDSTDSLPEAVDKIPIYEEMLRLMKPEETVTKALKRLGGNKDAVESRQRRWRSKKTKPSLPAEGEAAMETSEPSGERASSSSATSSGSEEDLEKLTGLVDKLVSEGEFEAYGFTFEKIRYELETRRNLAELKAAKSKAPGDELDMFAEEIDKSQLASSSAKTETPAGEKAPAAEGAAEKGAETSPVDDVQWEFKWENKEGASVYGPCSSKQMHDWQEEGYFKDGVWARRVNQQDAPFYSSKRIDFELYM